MCKYDVYRVSTLCISSACVYVFALVLPRQRAPPSHVCVKHLTEYQSTPFTTQQLLVLQVLARGGIFTECHVNLLLHHRMMMLQRGVTVFLERFAMNPFRVSLLLSLLDLNSSFEGREQMPQLIHGCPVSLSLSLSVPGSN